MSFKPLRALIGMIMALASLYVIYGTFGTALMVFKNAATTLNSQLSLSSGWLSIVGVSASNFDFWFSSVWVVGVAVIIYAVLNSISSTDYDRQGMG
jgi:hypothetical protein